RKYRLSRCLKSRHAWPARKQSGAIDLDDRISAGWLVLNKQCDWLRKFFGADRSNPDLHLAGKITTQGNTRRFRCLLLAPLFATCNLISIFAGAQSEIVQRQQILEYELRTCGSLLDSEVSNWILVLQPVRGDLPPSL